MYEQTLLFLSLSLSLFLHILPGCFYSSPTVEWWRDLRLLTREALTRSPTVKSGEITIFK
jgi:hypothetical protein